MRWMGWLSMLFVLSLVASSCGIGDEPKLRMEGAASEPALPTSSEAAIPSIDAPAPSEDDVFVRGCDPKTIGEEFGPISVAYAVDGGVLAPQPCLGEPDTVVENAWNELAALTPRSLIDGVVIVAGFDDVASDTLAFAGPLGDDSEEHLVAIGVASAVDDPQELRLTMAHELAHVFTQTTDQIDIAVFEDECDTFFNGFGCFQQDAYITAWVDQFWTPQELASLPRDFSVDIDGGEQRCLVDTGFPGSYAASHPEEDFAESFSAYVFDVGMPPGVQDRLDFFDDYPEFVEMRQAASGSAQRPPPNNFDECG